MNTYIITLKNNNDSKILADKAAKSCVKHNMTPIIYNAFDGTSNENIKIPRHSINQKHISLLKVKNLALTLPEIACFYSHYSLWCECVFHNTPIVILEHDAVIIKEYKNHEYQNAIVYLGNEDQLGNNKSNFQFDVNIIGYDYKFIRAAHAYSIDPFIAKNLISHVIKEGICRPLDVTIRSDYFSIVQKDIYAINENIRTTMPNRVLFEEPTKSKIINYG
jgi:glycosyl transferase family 25